MVLKLTPKIRGVGFGCFFKSLKVALNFLVLSFDFPKTDDRGRGLLWLTSKRYGFGLQLGDLFLKFTLKIRGLIFGRLFERLKVTLKFIVLSFDFPKTGNRGRILR